MKKGRYEMRLSGSGGQGVVLATVIIAEAALNEGKNIVQSQSYGPEARGGLCKAEVVLDDKSIGYPKVHQADFLLALTQQSLEKYLADSAPHALVLIDSSLHAPENAGERTIISAPILETASEVVGNKMTANIVALGAINELLSFASWDHLKNSVTRRVPAKVSELNVKAMYEGMKLISESAALSKIA